MGKLNRYALNTIYNTPQFITQDSFNPILAYIEKRNGILFDMPELPIPSENSGDDVPDSVDDLGEECNSKFMVIEIEGSLSLKPVYGLCGKVGVSYKELLDCLTDSIEENPNLKYVVMNFDSGGGEAQGCFEYAREFRKKCDQNNIKIFSYIECGACSAAYAWAVMSDEVYINPTGEAGSIGCVVALLDSSEAMKKEGYKRIFITAGKNKVPFNEDGTFKESFLNKIQQSVDKANDEFVKYVSEYSGISEETIRGFNADVFDAQEALERGLVTGIMTNSEFIDYLLTKE